MSFRLEIQKPYFQGQFTFRSSMKGVNWIINHRRIMKEMNYTAADMTMQRYAFSEQRGLNYCLSNKPPIPDNGGLQKSK